MRFSTIRAGAENAVSITDHLNEYNLSAKYTWRMTRHTAPLLRFSASLMEYRNETLAKKTERNTDHLRAVISNYSNCNKIRFKLAKNMKVVYLQ